jgi:hypothetical protein
MVAWLRSSRALQEFEDAFEVVVDALARFSVKILSTFRAREICEESARLVAGHCPEFFVSERVGHDAVGERCSGRTTA